MPQDPLRPVLLAHLDEAFETRAWHGPNLSSAIRGVSAEQALWRAAPGRHNIWEIAVHCAYWKHVVTRRLGAESGATLRGRGRNWPALPKGPRAAEWQRDRQLLRSAHEGLRETVAGVSRKTLYSNSPIGSGAAATETVLGIAAHDIYHAGQIRLLRRLMEEMP